MSTRNYPTTEESGLIQKKHKDSSPAGKTIKPDTPVEETMERIIQETSIKRQQAIKELANR